jgi:hypothetical protein
MRCHPYLILTYGSFCWLAFSASFSVMGLGTNPAKNGTTSSDGIRSQRRYAQESDANQELNVPACGEVLSTLRTEELRDYLDDLVQTTLGLSGAELLAFQAGILSEVDYGVKVVKVCGKCSDYTNLYDGVCQPQDYAMNVTHSG